MMSANNDSALALLDKCRELGIISTQYDQVGDEQYLIEADLVESGVIDSMSLVMLSELLKSYYGCQIEPSKFVMELRSLHAIARYMDEG